ncbi:hypothetical protein EAI30_12425 [Romboutsia ilealis]|uniref:histidine kinase n=1 Tax=Romboutsia faecis TaxID=2764597 RepID=A0ABR7JS70_9FIRM|nr:histidine kinase dimerization/phospho-acceptor domain-containing protein [Romboutsia faecis]MBC5997627.1 hypothetical protein [Romboutsia faecis]MRN25423.1 hypothetical protein [Romboutsia ilealis]
MSESIKSISKIYLFIIIIGYLLFEGVDTRILFNMILILNSCIAICCFLVTVSNFDLNKDKIYKQIAMLFTIKGIMNIVGGFSILTNLNKPIDLNKDLQIYVLATTIEVILLILITKSKKIELNINKIINICLISTSIGVLLIYNTTIFPKLYTKKGVTILFYVITFTFILGLLYALKNFKNIDKRASKRTLKDLYIYYIARVFHISIVFLSEILRKSMNIDGNFTYLVSIITSIIYFICVTRIYYFDIIKRPNQILYRNLLKEKEKLEEVSKGLKDYKHRYEKVLMYIPDGVIVSEDGKIVFINKKIKEYFNIENNDSILGKTIEELVDESEKECVKNLNDISNSLQYLNLKYNFNNTEFYGEQTTILKNRNNKILNISIIKNMEDKIKLAKIKEELEYNKTKEEIKDQVLANISHDFKTPINVIYSTVQMQDLNIKNRNYGNLLEFNNIIKQNCNRMIRLTNNFIDSIKLESDIINVNLKYVNIVNLVEEITLSVLNYAEDKNIELVFDTEQEEIYSLIDTDLMEKIMLNILSNSIKYNKKMDILM